MRNKNADNWSCEVCKRELPQGVIEYSLKYFGKKLCLDCQNEERLSKINPKYRDQLKVSLQK